MLEFYIVDLKNTRKDRLRCYFTGHISAGMAEPSSVIYGLETRVSWCILDLLQAPSDKLKPMLFLSCKHILLLGEPNGAKLKSILSNLLLQLNYCIRSVSLSLNFSHKISFPHKYIGLYPTPNVLARSLITGKRPMSLLTMIIWGMQMPLFVFILLFFAVFTGTCFVSSVL